MDYVQEVANRDRNQRLEWQDGMSKFLDLGSFVFLIEEPR